MMEQQKKGASANELTFVRSYLRACVCVRSLNSNSCVYVFACWPHFSGKAIASIYHVHNFLSHSDRETCITHARTDKSSTMNLLLLLPPPLLVLLFVSYLRPHCCI